MDREELMEVWRTGVNETLVRVHDDSVRIAEAMDKFSEETVAAFERLDELLKTLIPLREELDELKLKTARHQHPVSRRDDP